MSEFEQTQPGITHGYVFAAFEACAPEAARDILAVWAKKLAGAAKGRKSYRKELPSPELATRKLLDVLNAYAHERMERHEKYPAEPLCEGVARLYGVIADHMPQVLTETDIGYMRYYAETGVIGAKPALGSDGRIVRLPAPAYAMAAMKKMVAARPDLFTHDNAFLFYGNALTNTPRDARRNVEFLVAVLKVNPEQLEPLCKDIGQYLMNDAGLWNDEVKLLATRGKTESELRAIASNNKIMAGISVLGRWATLCRSELKQAAHGPEAPLAQTMAIAIYKLAGELKDFSRDWRVKENARNLMRQIEKFVSPEDLRKGLAPEITEPDYAIKCARPAGPPSLGKLWGAISCPDA